MVLMPSTRMSITYTPHRQQTKVTKFVHQKIGSTSKPFKGRWSKLTCVVERY